MNPKLREHRLSTITVLALALASASCSGKDGAPGTPGTSGAPGAAAVDHGSIAGTVKDQAGAAVAAASIATDPATVASTTDAAGQFTLASVPIGAYTVIASKTGYLEGRLVAVGVGAGGTVKVSLVLAKVAPTVGSISGTILGRSGAGTSVPVAAAQVCVAGTSSCSASASDGTYTLPGVAPGFVFVTATTNAYLPGETRQATFLAAGATSTGVDVTLSGRPGASATYLGSGACKGCHAATVAAWQGSAHANASDRTTAHVDVTGWPAAGDCTTPSLSNTHVVAADPADSVGRETWLVRWGAACGAGKPAFAMAFDTNASGAVDAGDTVIPVSGSAGGVATGAGQCGNGGILPASAPCSASLGGAGPTSAVGWWQQEYLTDIGGASKPSWVGWDTTSTPADALVMPLAWNQRTLEWIVAPDYNTAQDGTWSKACAGCHEVGITVTLDASGFVTGYQRVSAEIGCEKCHGPASAHVAASGDAALIVNPRYLTAQAEREACAQCHSQAVSSASPAGALGYAWNDQATVGGGSFIPGVHRLADFMSAPAFGDPELYWPAGFPSADHATAIDLGGSIHANNPYEKLTCAECHSGHGGTGGPVEIRRADETTGDQYVFQGNDAVLRDDVACLVCHASQGSFAAVLLSDVGAYHLSAGGGVQKNGATWPVTAEDQAKAASLVASTVNLHMIAKAAMPAYFDPTGLVGAPVGRCSSCHMAKTAFTGAYFSGPDATRKTANAIGDVSSHTFLVAWPDASLATVAGATTWDGVMPNACGSCHASYRFSK
jgi:hypothetical protein